MLPCGRVSVEHETGGTDTDLITVKDVAGGSSLNVLPMYDDTISGIKIHDGIVQSLPLDARMVAAYCFLRQANSIVRAATERYLISEREALAGVKAHNYLQTRHISSPRTTFLCCLTRNPCRCLD
jgi:hypothetical protein